MKSIKKWYLKWYYGYKNFWDELLALWVICYLFDHYPLEILYIEVEDASRFQERLDRHSVIMWDLLSKVKLVEKWHKRDVIKYSILSPGIHKFLWWWEVFAPARGWFHWWRNMLILYRLDFCTHNVTLLGWISKATNRWYQLLYSLTLPRCNTIILREKTSYEYVVNAFKLAKNTFLYHDFWYDIINSQKTSQWVALTTSSISCLSCPYMVVNCNPYIDMSILTDIVVKLTDRQSISTLVYFPWDKEDILFYDHLSLSLPRYTWTLFDWTKYDIWTAIALIRDASCAVWVRLHLLAMCQRIGIPYEYVIYQEKIEKFLATTSP